MDKTALIITLGNRDLTFDKEVDAVKEVLGEEDFDKMYAGKWQKFLARQGGEILLKHFNKVKDYLEIPIIQPALDYSFATLTGEKVIDTIILVATDQPDSVAEKFRNQDTIYLAELLKRLIPMKVKNRHNSKQVNSKLPKVKEVEILIIEGAVSFYDEMYGFWSNSLSKSPFTELKDYETIFLCTQAGTPQIKTTLLLKCMNLYGKKLDLLSINEEKDVTLSSGTRLVYPRQYLQDLAYQNVQSHLKQYNYMPLITMDLPLAVQEWAKYAHARLSFDFDLSHQVIQKISPKDIGGRQEQTNWKNEIMALKNGQNLLVELYWNARIKYQQGAYVDFLLRFFRVVEELAKKTAIELLGGFEYKHGKWGTQIEELLKKPAYQDLKIFLDGKKINGNKLIYKSSKIPTFKAIIEFYQSQKPKVYQFLQHAESLTELRNHSIGAHAFEPVSKKIIADVLIQSNTSMDDIFTFLDAQLIPFEENAFIKINTKIMRLMQAQKHDIL